MTELANYKQDIKHALTDAFAVCTTLGLIGGRATFQRQAAGVIVRCPVHTENTPSCSVQFRHGALLWKCHGCDAAGDALDLVAAVRGLDTRTNFKRVLIEAAEVGGLSWVAREIEDGVVSDRPRPVMSTPAPEPDRTYPPAHEVAALLAACGPVRGDAEATAMLGARGLDVDRIDADALAVVVPKTATLPRWARHQGASWIESGHRLIVPMRAPDGAIASVRAWRVTDGDTPKRLPPSGHRASGLVMSCPMATAMLEGRFAPSRVLVVEGEPDFLSGATLPMSAPTARLGLVSGSWTHALAPRFPIGTQVFVWTHLDQAGDRYAVEVVRGLQRSRGCRMFRWIPEEAS